MLTSDKSSTLPPSLILEMIEHHRFGVEYQPIISLVDNNIFAYEALARFYTPVGDSVSPQDVFLSLHTSPLTLFRVEYELKELQLDQAPMGYPLFLNLDPDAYAAWGDCDENNPLVSLVASRDQVVMEIIENADLGHASVSMSMVKAFRKRNIPVALDDIGAPDSMLAFPILTAVNYLKFDKSWIQLIDEKKNSLILLRSLIQYARQSGNKTILEGIETEDDLELAKELGVDYVQGFLFRPHFIRSGWERVNSSCLN